jgi:hypothetical protein
VLHSDSTANYVNAPIGVADLRECLFMRPANLGAERLGLSRALEIWKTLISMEEECGHLAVWRATGHARELVAVAISVFVKTEFAESEIENPRPGLNARILESIAEGKSVIADYEYIARANAAGTLNQVIMYCNTRRDLLSAEEDIRVRSILSHGYAEQFAGYHLARMVTEIIDAEDREVLANYPSISIASRFEDHYRAQGTVASDRVLCVATGATFSADPSSVGAPIFLGSTVPRFALSRGEKALLKGAINGMDDSEMAASLKRTPAALKRRWNQIFQKVTAVDPDLCPDQMGSVRGPQKRHRILSYLRKHPEELRPYRKA